MQPFGRPLARSILSGSNGLGTGLRLGTRSSLASPKPEIERPSTYLSSLPRSVASTRFYSTPLKHKDESTTAESQNKTDGSPITEPTTPGSASANSHPSNNIKEKFSQIMDHLQSRALTASQTLNDLTGYSDIERIKAENNHLETSLTTAHNRLRSARHAYKSSNAKRAATQREVTTLLARKESWSPTDLERFTELYRTDHVLEGEVASAQEALTEAEVEEQDLSQKLNAGILKRYHEEQIWSDRIRRASTWGTWGLMGMNFLLFIVVTFVAEPWRRRRLVRGVVEQEKEVLAELRAELAAVKAALEKRDIEEIIEDQAEVEAVQEADETIPAPTLTWGEFLADPAKWKVAAEDLYSERRLDLSIRDASTLALEGAAAGAALACSVIWILGRGA